MRVLFVATMGVGHVFPLVPLAWALRAAGHDVLVATADAGVPAAVGAGLAVVDAAPAFDREALFAAYRRDDPALVARLFDPDSRDLAAAVLPLARMSELMVDGVLETARSWSPDLVVQSQGQGAGLVAASALDLPVVDVALGFVPSADVHERLFGHLRESFARHGATGLPSRVSFVDVAPPSMRTRPGTAMRYVPYNGGGTVPGWLLRPAERPRVAVTLGTVSWTGPSALDRVVAAAAGVDADFVLALDGPAPATLPDNVRSLGWTPLHAILPHCAALLHHGGAGTTLTALAAGVPQLLLPNGADRHINADAVIARGAGRSAATPSTALITDLLASSSTRAAAAEVAAEMSTMPDPMAVLAELV